MAARAEGGAGVLVPARRVFCAAIRAMAPVELPDPSMHTVYIVDPAQMFVRYRSAFAATARMREGAQAGFLVLARLMYLAFGAVPGFYAMRYVLALVAVVPAYVLLRRLYGSYAGVIAIVVLLSSPVILTAWGTDYPDSAVVSYVPVLCCLAMPCHERRRPAWLVAGGPSDLRCLVTWDGGSVSDHRDDRRLCGRVPGRARTHFVRDGLLLAGVGLLATLCLMVASGLVLGQFDFIGPTLAGRGVLEPALTDPSGHSSSWRWAPLSGLPARAAFGRVAFWVTFKRRLRTTGTPQLIVGLAVHAQLALFSYLQFFNHVQTLEMHFFSATLWGVISIALALTIAELTKPLSHRPLAGFLPAALLLAIPLAYEADPNVPAFGWWPAGAGLAALPVAAAVVIRLVSRGGSHAAIPLGLRLATMTTVVAVAGSLLVLTVAPSPPHARIPGVVNVDAPVSYASALGGNATLLIDWYQVTTELPSFVGNATYKGEQLMMWYPIDQSATLIEPIGIYHAGFDSLSGGFANGFPVLTASDKGSLRTRRPAELLLLSLTGADFTSALHALAPYRPVVTRKGVLRQGQAVLHLWLITLRVFAQPPQPGSS